MSKKKPITKEDLIAKIEARLRQPDLDSRMFNSLSRKLSVLRGWTKPYARTVAERTQPEEPVPSELPKWWTDDWAKVFISERAHGIRSASHWERELSQFAAKWAKSEGLTVEQLYEALRREDAEWKKQHPTHEGYNDQRDREYRERKARSAEENNNVAIK